MNWGHWPFNIANFAKLQSFSTSPKRIQYRMKKNRIYCIVVSTLCQPFIREAFPTFEPDASHLFHRHKLHPTHESADRTSLSRYPLIRQHFL